MLALVLFTGLAKVTGAICAVAGGFSQKAKVTGKLVAERMTEDFRFIAGELISTGTTGAAALLALCGYYDDTRKASIAGVVAEWEKAVEATRGTLKDAKASGRNVVNTYLKPLQYLLWGVENAPEVTTDAFSPVPTSITGTIDFTKRLAVVIEELRSTIRRKRTNIIIYTSEAGYLYLASMIEPLSLDERAELGIIEKLDDAGERIGDKAQIGKTLKSLEAEQKVVARRSKDVASMIREIELTAMNDNHMVKADHACTKNDS
jgi:hypothetical protein